MIREQVLMKLIQEHYLQEFTYLEVPTGQGVYTWNDYNTNGVQELQEFEVAPFIDQAKYIRCTYPIGVYKTHQTKFSQSIILNPNQWQNATDLKNSVRFFIIKPPSLLIEKQKRRWQL
jgi:hypothetical protein